MIGTRKSCDFKNNDSLKLVLGYGMCCLFLNFYSNLHWRTQTKKAGKIAAGKLDLPVVSSGRRAKTWPEVSENYQQPNGNEANVACQQCSATGYGNVFVPKSQLRDHVHSHLGFGSGSEPQFIFRCLLCPRQPVMVKKAQLMSHAFVMHQLSSPQLGIDYEDERSAYEEEFRQLWCRCFPMQNFVEANGKEKLPPVLETEHNYRNLFAVEVLNSGPIQ